MSELLSKEQLDAVRGAVASLDQLYADHPQLRGSRFEENQILFESLTSNSVTIRALLAHIDALEAVLAALTTPDASGYIGYDPNFPERHFCTYCGESWGVGSDEWHTADCVFARARALLE